MLWLIVPILCVVMVIFLSAVNSNGQAAPRTGLFHFFKKQEILVYRWDVTNEDVSTDGVTQETVDGITTGR